MRTTRAGAAVAAVLAVGIAGAAIALVAEAPATTRPSPAHLAVGPGPPRTATAQLTYADSTGVTIDATLQFDFAHGRADVTAVAALSLASLEVEARLVGTTLYIADPTLASLTGAPWVAARAPRAAAALERLATFLRDPRLSERHLRHATVSRTRTSTTTALAIGRVTLPQTRGLPISLPPSGVLSATVTTGPRGQVLAATARLSGSSDDASASLLVTGYNVPVDVPVPARDETVALTPARARAIFGTNAPAVLRLLARLDAR